MAHVTTADEADGRVDEMGIYADLADFPEIAVLVREAVRASPYLTDANMGGLDALKAETHRLGYGGTHGTLGTGTHADRGEQL